jgi:hypothetical protein
MWQFLFLVVFSIIFVADMIFGSKGYGLSEEKNVRLNGYIATRVVCQILILYFSYFEILHIRRIGFIEYINILWNVNDMLLTLTYTTYLIFSFVQPT